MDISAAKQYCIDKTVDSGSSFYHAFRFLDKPQREAMMALYAFCREVDDVVDETADVEFAKRELQTWRQRLRDLNYERAEHPVMIALNDARRHYNLSISLFQELIDGMEMDLQQHSYANFAELQLYCYRVASVVGLLSIEIFGYSHTQTRSFAYDLGIAFQLTNILRDVGEDARRGRIYIPQDELAQFGVAAPSLLASDSRPLQALFAMQAERAMSYYASAIAKLPSQDRQQMRVAMVMSAIYKGLLTEIIKRDYRVLESRIKLSKFQKIRLAVSSARAEKRLSNNLAL